MGIILSSLTSVNKAATEQVNKLVSLNSQTTKTSSTPPPNINATTNETITNANVNSKSNTKANVNSKSNTKANVNSKSNTKANVNSKSNTKVVLKQVPENTTNLPSKPPLQSKPNSNIPAKNTTYSKDDVGNRTTTTPLEKHKQNVGDNNVKTKNVPCQFKFPSYALTQEEKGKYFTIHVGKTTLPATILKILNKEKKKLVMDDIDTIGQYFQIDTISVKDVYTTTDMDPSLIQKLVKSYLKYAKQNSSDPWLFSCKVPLYGPLESNQYITLDTVLKSFAYFVSSEVIVFSKVKDYENFRTDILEFYHSLFLHPISPLGIVKLFVKRFGSVEKVNIDRLIPFIGQCFIVEFKNKEATINTLLQALINFLLTMKYSTVKDIILNFINTLHSHIGSKITKLEIKLSKEDVISLSAPLCFQAKEATNLKFLSSTLRLLHSLCEEKTPENLALFVQKIVNMVSSGFVALIIKLTLRVALRNVKDVDNVLKEKKTLTYPTTKFKDYANIKLPTRLIIAIPTNLMEVQ